MGLKSIVRRRKPGYTKGHPYKLFRNILEQDFTCDEINTKWCTDFTYLYLSDGNLLTQRTIIEDLAIFCSCAGAHARGHSLCRRGLPE